MRRLNWVFTSLFVIAIPLFLVSNSVVWAVNSPGLYKEGFEKYNIASVTGILDSDLHQVGADLRRYFNTRDGPISLRARVRGVEREIFNPREVLHMRDVKRLIWLVYGVATLSGIYLLLATGVGVAWRRNFSREVARLCVLGGTPTMVLVLAIGIFALVGFDTLFLKFHQFSFANDLWQLDPRTDYLVMLFPQGFWFDATIWVATRAVAGAVLLVALFGGYLVYRQWTAPKRARGPLDSFGSVNVGQPDD